MSAWHSQMQCLVHTIRKSGKKYSFWCNRTIIWSSVHSFQELIMAVHAKLSEGANTKNVFIWYQNVWFSFNQYSIQSKNHHWPSLQRELDQGWFIFPECGYQKEREVTFGHWGWLKVHSLDWRTGGGYRCWQADATGYHDLYNLRLNWSGKRHEYKI